jgi:multiple sugar transport system substrate-binding protein
VAHRLHQERASRAEVHDGAVPGSRRPGGPVRLGADCAGDIVAIPKGSKHPDEAWLLIKFLASDTDAIVGLSNRLRNLPTTKAANSSPKLDKDPHFAPFFKIFTNTKSEFNPLTPIGQQYGDTFQAFATKWQAGKVSDLTKGLQGLDKQISDELKQASAGNAP